MFGRATIRLGIGPHSSLIVVFVCLCRYERFEVLVVFASTILAQFGALFIVKERLNVFSNYYPVGFYLI